MVQLQVLSLWQPSDLLSASKDFRVKDSTDLIIQSFIALLWPGLPLELQNANVLSGVHLQVHPATMMLCDRWSMETHGVMLGQVHTHMLQHGTRHVWIWLRIAVYPEQAAAYALHKDLTFDKRMQKGVSSGISRPLSNSTSSFSTLRSNQQPVSVGFLCSGRQ
jgi:hypothetical protein